MKHLTKVRNQFGKTQRKNKFTIILKILLAVALLVSGSPVLATAQAPQGGVTKIDLASSIRSAGLPIGQVESFPVKDAKGTAVLIPQVHQYPGTQAADPANDSAQRAQGQIYQIVSYLTKDGGISLVMAEGDVYGQVNGQKIIQLKTKIDAKNQLVELTKKLKASFQQQSLDSGLESRLLTGLENIIQSTDREIILKGAPYKLKAEGAAFTIYGAEVPATYEAAANVVRDYIYLQDRTSQLSGSGLNSAIKNSASSRSLDLKSVLSKLRPAQSTLDSDITQLQRLAASKGKDGNTSLLAEIQKNLGQLTVQQTVASQAPARANNPYANVSDANVLKSKLKAAEANIQRIVVDQRNSETAENFARMLADAGQPTGILQFGAQHEKGLVQELQKQGISVIVVTSQEVLAGNKTKAAATRKQTASSQPSGAAKTSSALQKLAEQLKQKKLASPKQNLPQPNSQLPESHKQKLESLRAKYSLLQSKALSR